MFIYTKLFFTNSRYNASQENRTFKHFREFQNLLKEC